MAIASGAAGGLWLSCAEKDDPLLARFADRALSRGWTGPNGLAEPERPRPGKSGTPETLSDAWKPQAAIPLSTAILQRQRQHLIPSTIGDRLAVGKQRSHIDETCLWMLFLLPQAVYG